MAETMLSKNGKVALARIRARMTASEQNAMDVGYANAVELHSVRSVLSKYAPSDYDIMLKELDIGDRQGLRWTQVAGRIEKEEFSSYRTLKSPITELPFSWTHLCDIARLPTKSDREEARRYWESSEKRDATTRSFREYVDNALGVSEIPPADNEEDDETRATPAYQRKSANQLLKRMSNIVTFIRAQSDIQFDVLLLDDGSASDTLAGLGVVMEDIQSLTSELLAGVNAALAKAAAREADEDAAAESSEDYTLGSNGKRLVAKKPPKPKPEVKPEAKKPEAKKPEAKKPEAKKPKVKPSVDKDAVKPNREAKTNIKSSGVSAVVKSPETFKNRSKPKAAAVVS